MPNTPDQQLAIDTIDRNVSVSAGAGSGKTAVLKQRFLRILKESKYEIDKKYDSMGRTPIYTPASAYEGIKASNIVGITFTRKAAGEIKTRIREAMMEDMNSGDEVFWRMQLRELEKGQINTIHGLCSRILRENPVEANLDPSFVLSEDMDYEAFKEECIRDFLRKELRSEEENSTKYLVNILGAGSLYNQLSSLVEELEDIAAEGDLVAPYRESDALLQDKLDELMDKITWMAENRDDLMKKSTKAYQALAALGSDLPLIEKQLVADSCDLSLVDTHLAMRPSGKLTPYINEARELSKNIKSYLVDKAAVPIMEHWGNLIKELNDYIKAQKEIENILTYDDLETKAIELLSDNEEIRHKYHKKFQHFMVDEFQDTNDKQCALIYLLCGDSKYQLEGNKLFVVGDPKQSIYRFNGADVDVFERVVQQIGATGGRNISMKTNFRSKDKILDCCNETFAHIMGAAGATVKFEALDCADFNMEHLVFPELISIDPEDPEARTMELHAVAKKIKALANAECVSENDEADSRVYGEMAVLLRTMTRVNDLTQVLAEYEIPYVVVDGKGFFQRQEICDIINLWDVIHNSYQNIPLAGILKSPYFAFDDELLMKICLKDEYLWDALHLPYDEFKAELNNDQLLALKTAVEKFNSIMESIRFMDVDAAWNKLWNIFDIEVVLSLQNNGKQKLANVQKLRKLSLDYCHENSVGVADWLAYIKDAMAMGAEETNANLDATDAVQIMTIHKSKGLEFKRVFIPFLGAKGHTDSRTIVYAKGIGLGIQLLNHKGEFVPTSVFKDIKESEKIKDLQERQRILYVGMTRPEEELYMFGIPAKNPKDFDVANWMDQLSLIYSDYPGVIKSFFSADDIELSPLEIKNEAFILKEEEEKLMEPIPSFTTSGRKLFTASALTHYLYCPRQYYYSEYMGLPAFEEQVISETKDMSASAMGSIIHEALEKYNGQDNLLPVFRAAAKHYAPGCNTNRAWEILLDYVNSELFHSIPKEQLHEKEFLVQTKDDLLLNGFIDVLATNPDGTLSVIDYKTGEPPKSGDEELGYMYQLAIYSYAAEKLFGKKVSKAELHFLQNKTSFALTKKNAFEEAMDLAKEIAAKTKEEEFACNHESCKHCGYNYLCRKE